MFLMPRFKKKGIRIMKKCLTLLLTLAMLFALTACGKPTQALEKTPETEVTEPSPAAEKQTEETPNPFVEMVYEEGTRLLQAGKYKEAYDDFVAAADSGSTAAMEALARGVILDKSLAEAAAGDDETLLRLSRSFAEAGDPWGLWTAGFLCMNGRGTGIRYEEAFRNFERAAESDNDEVKGLALYEIGYMLANGYYDRDGEKALESFEKAADLGNTYAMGNLGLSYAKGTLTEKNVDTALDWFSKALETGDGNAKTWILSTVNQLGYDCLFPSDGSEPDYGSGKQYYALTAGQDDQDGLFYTGVIYGQGWGVEKDSVKAVNWFQKALDQGSSRAAYNLAVLYTYGDSEIRQNLDKGLDYFCQAAKLGYEGTADLMNDIGVKILNGDGFQQDPALAVTWYEKAAEAGSVYACNNLGYLYSYHAVKGVDQDLEKALSYFKKVAELGDENASTAIYTVAMNLLQGKEGLKKDPKTAALWLEESAGRLHTPSMLMLGLLYSDKQYQKDVEQDVGKALKWLEMAANSGETDAMKKLGELYSAQGSEVLDYQKAFDRYAEAADACDPENTKELAQLAAYINNIGVACCSDAESESYNPDLAFKAFSKAAELGQKDAVLNLAKAYGTGLGTKQDMDKANELLDQAKYQGNRDYFLGTPTWTQARV